MRSLPSGWASARLADVAEVRLGRQRSPKRATGERMRPYLRAANVGWQGLKLDDVKEMDFSEAESATYALRPGDLLLAEASGSAGEVGKPGQYRGEIDDCYFQNTLIRVRLPEGLLPDFYEHFFRHEAMSRRFADGSRGVGIHHLGAATLSNWWTPIPPAAEQGRIVAAIEEAFSLLDAGETALQNTRTRLKRMRDSVLTAAVTGQLVPQDPTDTPADKLLADLGVASLSDAGPQLPESWCSVALGDVTSIGGGIQKQPKRRPSQNPVPFLRVANVGRGSLDLTEVHDIEVFDGELDRYGLQVGDLLVVEGNGSPDQIGRAAVWDGQIAPCVHQNHLIRVRPGPPVDAGYLGVYWNSPEAAARVQAVASSTSGLHTLSTGKLKGLPVALPPLEEQSRIVAEVERQFSFIEAAERAVDAGLARSKGLRRSVLQAAFEGRLVEQDPSDEPTSVLLERIAVARAAAAPRKRAPGRVRGKVVAS